MVTLTKKRTDHDQMFKGLISTFFEEFMILFFPQIHEQLDFQETDFLNQELFTDVTEGDRHVVDLLIKTKWKGTDSIVIVHVEAQADHQETFNQRMFIYFSRIYQIYQQPIIPIAIFSYDTPKNEPTSLNMSFPFGDVLNFQYFIVELKKLDWRQFIRQENPVAAALLSKMGYNKKERIKVKIEFFRILMRLKLNEAQEQLLTGFFETYLKFNDKEEKIFIDEVKKLGKEESDKVMEIMSSYKRKGIEEGIEQGIEQGIEKGIEEGAIKIAKRMIETNKPLDEIVDMTELSKDVVEQLIKEAKSNN